MEKDKSTSNEKRIIRNLLELLHQIIKKTSVNSGLKENKKRQV
jgi:hypothetical protein